MIVQRTRPWTAISDPKRKSVENLMDQLTRSQGSYAPPQHQYDPYNPDAGRRHRLSRLSSNRKALLQMFPSSPRRRLLRLGLLPHADFRNACKVDRASLLCTSQVVLAQRRLSLVPGCAMLDLRQGERGRLAGKNRGAWWYRKRNLSWPPS